METMEITKANALKAYNGATKDQKEMLEKLFGKEKLAQKITDRVKTFEDAVALVGISPNQMILLAYNGQEPQMLSSQAHLKLSIIAAALNEGWKPDFTDSSQYKYYPWMKYTPGVGFSFLVDDYDYSYSFVGSRLCYKSSELAEYAAKQFQSIYNDFLS